jgi:hypothetical protein
MAKFSGLGVISGLWISILDTLFLKKELLLHVQMEFLFANNAATAVAIFSDTSYGICTRAPTWVRRSI